MVDLRLPTLQLLESPEQPSRIEVGAIVRCAGHGCTSFTVLKVGIACKLKYPHLDAVIWRSIHELTVIKEAPPIRKPEPPMPTTPLLPAPKIAGLLPAVTGQAYAWVRVGPREYAVPGRIMRVFTSSWDGQLTLDIYGDHPSPQASGFRLHVPYSQAMWTRPAVDNREWRRAAS